MYDPLTYRHPRTMEQAFGPCTDHVLYPIEEEPKMDIQDKIVMAASFIAAIVCAIVIVLGGTA